jgi:DNA-binding transcriptional ArsR family regulator
MRTSPLIDALFGRTRQQILAATLMQPEHRWYLRELARHLGVRASSLQRELKMLSNAGILKRSQDGNRVYFQADTASPVFAELSGIIMKTVGLVEVLQHLLRPLEENIRVAFVYGSMARSLERGSSDIDLMVIGNVPLSGLAPILRQAETKLGRPVNPTVYTPAEFKERLARENHFLTSVLRGESLFVIGGADELAKLASGTKNKTSPDEPPGNRRSSKRR